MERILPPKQYHEKKSNRNTYERIEPGEFIILLFGVSLAVAFIDLLLGNILIYYFPAIPFEPFQWIGMIALLTFIVCGCTIVCCAD